MANQVSFIQGPRGPRGERGEDGGDGAVGPTGPAFPNYMLATTLGIYHSTDSAGPVGWTSLTAAQQAAANSAAIVAWQNNVSSSYVGSTLFFEKPGTFYFLPDTILIPGLRALEGINTTRTILQLAGSAGTYFIRPNGPPFVTLKNLSLRGGGTAATGSDALCDYVLYTAGTLSPNVAGPTMNLYNVDARRAKKAVLRARNAGLSLDHFTAANFVEIGIWSEGCSEVEADTLVLVGHAASEYLALIEGLYAGTATRSGEQMTNGGLWRMRGLTGALSEVGICWNGVAGGGLDLGTVEGSSVYSYEFIKSAGVHCARLRSNAGNYAHFNDSISCDILQGSCVSTQKVDYTNDAERCFAAVGNETNVTDVPIEHRFGALQWTAYRNAEGQWISKANNAPTDGMWAAETEIKRSRASGQPFYFVCTTKGNPNGGTGVFGNGPVAP